MWVARLLTLLLPLGIWLVQSTATPRSQESRLASCGIVAIMVSFLAYFATGFGFMFGGISAMTNINELNPNVSYFALPVIDQTWGIIGLRGFMLNSVTPAAIDLYISFAPLVATAAVMLAGIMVSRAGTWAQVAAVAFISGVVFPIVGCWIWGGGWLASLGTNMSLGHGAVDIGGITTAALVAGGAGITWLIRVSRAPLASLAQYDRVVSRPKLPPAYHPFRGLAGIVLMITGASAFFAGNPLYSSSAPYLLSSMMVNSIVACSVATLIALGYSVYTLHRPDMLLAGRAVLAALIVTSAGGVLYTSIFAAILGILAALIAIVGAYTLTTVLKLNDDIGIVTTSLLASGVGLLCVGLFADGQFGGGWNNVGVSTYMGAAGLGISGMFSSTLATADPGQLTAQATMVIAILAFTALAFALLSLLVLHGARPQYVAQSEPAPESLQPASAYAAHERIPSDAPKLVIVSQETFPTQARNTNGADAQKPPQNRPLTLLDRLRAARDANKPAATPTQARHVAYPVRIGGRRTLIRPLTQPREAPGGVESSEKGA